MRLGPEVVLPTLCRVVPPSSRPAGDTISSQLDALADPLLTPTSLMRFLAYHCMRCNRQLATASQAAKEGAFGSARESGKFVIKFADCSNRHFVVCARFNPKRAWPTAGSISFAGSAALIRFSNPRRRSPRACENQRVILAFIQLRKRVSTLPRSSLMIRSARRYCNCASRRGLEVPMAAPFGRERIRRLRGASSFGCKTSASRGSSTFANCGDAQTSGTIVGKSFRE